MGGSGLLSSSLPFSADFEDHRYLQQKKRHNKKFWSLSFSVFRSASPYRSVLLFFWLRLLLYFRRPTLGSRRLACGRQVLWVLPCLDCWRWPRRYWSWRWRCGVVVALLSVLGAKIPKQWAALFFFLFKGKGRLGKEDGDSGVLGKGLLFVGRWWLQRSWWAGKLGSYGRVSLAGSKRKKKERQQWGEIVERGKGLWKMGERSVVASGFGRGVSLFLIKGGSGGLPLKKMKASVS